jgi:hypothetical protein
VRIDTREPATIDELEALVGSDPRFPFVAAPATMEPLLHFGLRHAEGRSYVNG